MKSRKIRRKVKNAILRTLVAFNFMSLVILVCAADSFRTWKPFAVMIFNIGFLALMGYANGLMDVGGEYGE